MHGSIAPEIPAHCFLVSMERAGGNTQPRSLGRFSTLLIARSRDK